MQDITERKVYMTTGSTTDVAKSISPTNMDLVEILVLPNAPVFDTFGKITEDNKTVYLSNLKSDVPRTFFYISDEHSIDDLSKLIFDISTLKKDKFSYAQGNLSGENFLMPSQPLNLQIAVALSNANKPYFNDTQAVSSFSYINDSQKLCAFSIECRIDHTGSELLPENGYLYSVVIIEDIMKDPSERKVTYISNQTKSLGFDTDAFGSDNQKVWEPIKPTNVMENIQTALNSQKIFELLHIKDKNKDSLPLFENGEINYDVFLSLRKNDNIMFLQETKNKDNKQPEYERQQLQSSSKETKLLDIKKIDDGFLSSNTTLDRKLVNTNKNSKQKLSNNISTMSNFFKKLHYTDIIAGVLSGLLVVAAVATVLILLLGTSGIGASAIGIVALGAWGSGLTMGAIGLGIVSIVTAITVGFGSMYRAEEEMQNEKIVASQNTLDEVRVVADSPRKMADALSTADPKKKSSKGKGEVLSIEDLSADVLNELNEYKGQDAVDLTILYIKAIINKEPLLTNISKIEKLYNNFILTSGEEAKMLIQNYVTAVKKLMPALENTQSIASSNLEQSPDRERVDALRF